MVKGLSMRSNEPDIASRQSSEPPHTEGRAREVLAKCRMEMTDFGQPAVCHSLQRAKNQPDREN